MSRNCSVSRMSARPGTPSSGRIRSTVAIVCRPTIPSGSLPTFRWNSRTARSVMGPYTPSCLPASNPRAFSFRWRSRTSSPRNGGAWRYSVRSPSRKPDSTSCIQVSGPTRPSARRWRRSWKARTAASVDGPNHPVSSSAARAYPSLDSRCWMSRTSRPRSPGLNTRISRVCDAAPGAANEGFAAPYKCGARSRRIASFGLAPITRATSCPPLNRISEGIDMTP